MGSENRPSSIASSREYWSMAERPNQLSRRANTNTERCAEKVKPVRREDDDVILHVLINN